MFDDVQINAAEKFFAGYPDDALEFATHAGTFTFSYESTQTDYGEPLANGFGYVSLNGSQESTSSCCRTARCASDQQAGDDASRGAAARGATPEMADDLLEWLGSGVSLLLPA